MKRFAVTLTVLGLLSCGEAPKKSGAQEKDGDSTVAQADGGAAATPGGADSLMPWERSIWNATCYAMFECGNHRNVAPLTEHYGGRYSTRKECESNPSPQAIDVAARAAFDAGTLEVDNEALEECEAQVRRTLCDEESYEPYDYDCDVFIGKVPDGGECITHIECETAGASCSNDGDTCGRGVCDPHGHDCYGAVCSDDEYCDDDDERCTRLADDGESCEYWYHCRDGLTCHREPDDSTGACIPLGSREWGESCRWPEECVPGLTCPASGGCTPYNEIAVGEECDFTGVFPCEIGTTCRFVGGGDEARCVPPAAEGEECWWLPECGPGLTCIETSSDGTATCQPFRPNGEDCVQDTDCQSNFCLLEDRAAESGTCARSHQYCTW